MQLILLVFLNFISPIHRPLSDVRNVNSYNPSWSPDGKMIAFENNLEGKSAIYTIPSDGTRLKRISDTISDCGQPAWSPDGRHVVYYGGVHPMKLYRNDTTGKRQKKLATPEADAYEPSWSVNNRIAFDSRDTGQTFNDISAMDADGSQLVKLTDSKYNYASPKWSPNGKRILFERTVAVRKKWNDITKEERKQMRDSAEIMVMNADGSDIINLTQDASEQRSPSWSPKGDLVFYKSKNDSTTFIHALNLFTKESKIICSIRGVVFGYSVSPDGNRILYSAKKNTVYSIYLYDIKTGDEKIFFGE